MTATFAARALATLLLTGSAALAAAQSVPPDLYQQALQSIAEGRNSDASDMLMRVIDNEPQHAGAWLEVALIQCSLGHADEAERLFTAIEARFSPPPGIMELIEDARNKGCDHWQVHSQGSFTAGRGIDQNVNQGAANGNFTVIADGVPINVPLTADFQPKHDQYTVIGGEYLRDISPNGSIGFAQLQARRNDNLHQYDSASLFVGAETPWRFGRWTLRSTSMLGLVGLGGQLFQRHAQFQARVGPPIPLPGSTQFHLIGGFSHVDYRTLSNFDSNTGELKGQFSYRGDALSASLTSGYLNDHAIGDRPGGNRHGWLNSLQLRRALDFGATGELGYVRQSWQSALPYSPGVIDTVRGQVTHVLRGTLIYPLAKNHNLQIEARQIWNRENISIFQYNNRILQVSWQWNGL
ncbi:MAG: tetratricopeptide repeat protein [Pseudomonadota bacterium]